MKLAPSIYNKEMFKLVEFCWGWQACLHNGSKWIVYTLVHGLNRTSLIVWALFVRISGSNINLEGCCAREMG
jgi:hypothetical protein